MSDFAIDQQEQKNREVALEQLDKDLKHIQLEYEVFGGPAFPKAKDPNDYEEDDKVPADPQGRAEEDSYKS